MNIQENFDRWMFDFKEGNLSATEMDAFENFLVQNPQFEVDADAWNSSYIQNENFVYPNAAQLEKDNRIVAGWFGWAAAAAIFILVGTSVFFLTNKNDMAIEGASTHEQNGDNINPVSHNNLNDNANLKDLTDRSNLSASNNGTYGNEILNNVNGSFVSNHSNSNGANSNSLNGSNSSNNGVDGNHNPNGLANNVDKSNQDLNVFPSMTSPTQRKNALAQEVDKYKGDNNHSKYQGNPESKDLAFNVNKKVSYDAKNGKLKKIYKKIEKMLDYPVGLTNLRDPELSLPNNSIVAFNPGFAGGMLAPRFEVNYRNQWLGSDQNSQQMTMSFDNYVYALRGGVGVVLNAKDYKYGQYGDYNLSLLYSPKILLSKDIVFEPAIKLTMGALTGNGNQLTPDTEMELERGHLLGIPSAQQVSGHQQLWYKDYGLGFVLNTKWFYTGLNVDNINRHYENVYNEEGYATPTSTPMMISAIAGFDYEAKRRPQDKPMSLSPYVAYQQYGARKEIWTGLNFRLNSITIGGSVNQKLDFSAQLGIKRNNFRIAYQYDYTRSSLANEQLGSHNISLRFNGDNKRTRINR